MAAARICFSPLLPLLLLLEREEEEREREEEDAKEVLSAVNILRARSLCGVGRECVRAVCFLCEELDNLLLFSTPKLAKLYSYNENVPKQ